ncbi:outer membrane protein assembly factor BamC [Thiorhodovibrio frisius]|uniref:Putative lipoprotein n=1 Tax=Thiorhodovibrio frisius TaxID=631362 RepID=H8YXN7_9GAMM|nr:outer membrane protein assembly factor BamC [Thiorhodovibrio frisius]EIC23213.1 putative lipoprotein [Thiorhodovibrio frisius]WPL23710.1 lipoprotein [Thiorhodovibrio frisius]
MSVELEAKFSQLNPRILGSRLAVASVASVVAASLMTGCGIRNKIDKVLPDQRLEYKHQREAGENLELPPDLTAASFDDALDIPPASGITTYSEYTGTRERRQRVAGSGEVLPSVAGVEMERSGDKRWLQIDQSPQLVWPQVVAFWRQQGILLVEQEPSIGVMKTDWIENRAEVRRDIVTKMFRTVVDGLYSTSTRDQYRVRIDAGPRPGTTEVYLTHRAMEERLVRNTLGEEASTVWEPAPSDPGKEGAMLRRLMLSLGVSEQQAQRMLAQQGSSAPTRSAQLVQSGGGALVIAEPYRQAWRQVGLALDRSGFAVEDRNRSEGVFYVRYDDPNRSQGKKKGLGSRLAFWKNNNKDLGVEQYQVRLNEAQGQTRVTIHDSNGNPDTSPTAGRILSLLSEEMR